MSVPIERISPKRAHELLTEGYVYVDVRTVPEFEGGHPQGALNVPFAHPGPSGMVPNPRFLEVMRARFARDAKLVLGCLSGGRSLAAAELLARDGFASVVDQRAGWGGVRDPFGGIVEAGWQREGLPTETEADPAHRYATLELLLENQPETRKETT
jgi:rhodanese-related sulfurtransferase